MGDGEWVGDGEKLKMKTKTKVGKESDEMMRGHWGEWLVKKRNWARQSSSAA